jgi:pyrroline-5-carboxylate reductase
MDSLQNSPPSASSSDDLPPRLPSHFNACVRSKRTADRIRSELSPYSKLSLSVLENENVKACREADVVLLACKPFYVKDVLSAPDIKQALEGKLIVSILAGVTEEAIEQILYPDLSHEQAREKVTVVRTMPNTCSKVRESMTVIATPVPDISPEDKKIVHWMMAQIGAVSELPASNIDACTALCGSGPAFVALMIEALADGGVAMGIPRQEANIMAAQMVRGTTGLIQGGEHAAILREKVSTPGGCTIGGLLVLEEGAVRGTVSRAVREATVVASLLGSGAKGVNGTRR